MDEEPEAFVEPEATCVPFMRQRFPNLHTHDDRLCQPNRWHAEDITPHLADEEGELWLYAADRMLVLKPDRTWRWLKHPQGAQDENIYYAPQHPSATFGPVVRAEFEPAEVEDLPRWRLRLLDLTETNDEPDGADAL